jgi:hypothetical protein
LKNMEEVTSVNDFTIHYGQYAVTWPSRQELRWGIFKWNPVARTWRYHDELDSVAYRVLLKKFGLLEHIADLPLEKVAAMSPQALRHEQCDRTQVSDDDTLMSDGDGPPRLIADGLSAIQ